MRSGQADEVRRFAAEHLVTTSAAIRILVARGLRRDAAATDELALAGLVASEHVLLALGLLIPDGGRRIEALFGAAPAAAEHRLAWLSERLEEARGA